MGFPKSFVGTGVLDCPFCIPPRKVTKNISVPRRGGYHPPAFLRRNTNPPKNGNPPIISIPVGRGLAPAASPHACVSKHFIFALGKYFIAKQFHSPQANFTMHRLRCIQKPRSARKNRTERDSLFCYLTKASARRQRNANHGPSRSRNNNTV